MRSYILKDFLYHLRFGASAVAAVAGRIRRLRFGFAPFRFKNTTNVITKKQSHTRRSGNYTSRHTCRARNRQAKA